MHRPPVTIAIVLVAFALSASGAVAQRIPPRPPTGGGTAGAQACGEGCGGDTQAPIVFPMTAGNVTTQYPYIEIQFCDNISLDASSRQIKVNGVSQVSAFSYTTGVGDECTGEGLATSTTTTVALNVGSNTMYAAICDNAGNCGNQSWTITRTAGPLAPVVALRNHNSDNRDRSFCLTMGAGQSAGLSCGDLFVEHATPSFSTMGRERQLTLIYSSATAVPRPIVAATVTQSSTGELPASVYAELKIDGGAGYSVRSSATYSGWAVGAARGIVLGYDASSDATGVYPFTLVVRNSYTSSAPTETSVSGTLIVVNGSASEFGAGWWPVGVERLQVLSSPSRLLWIAADGSAAVYDSTGANAWQRRAGGFRDQIVLTGAQYVRSLRHGIEVRFNLAGQHVSTVNRAGQTTSFNWAAPPGDPSVIRLLSITVPPADSGRSYALSYAGTYQYISGITDPAGRTTAPSAATYLYGTKYTIASITDPDSRQAAFTYDGVGRLLTRTSRRGNTTSYQYTNGLHVTRATLPVGRTSSDAATSVTDFEWWDEKGAAICSTSCSRTAVDTSSVFTKVYGARPDVADDATFWVDRWGAATRIVDAIGGTTVINRGSSTVPALPTRVIAPMGAIDSMAWDARGNLVLQLDSTAHLTAGLPTRITRWEYLSDSTLDSPSRIIGTDGLSTYYSYNALGLPASATGPNGHVTSFRYLRTGRLAGLLDSVIERQVPHVDSAAAFYEPTSDIASRFAYNLLGNPIGDTTPMGRARALVRDPLTQRVTATTDAGGHRTTLAYDVLNRITASQVHVEDAPADSGFTTYLETAYQYVDDVLDAIVDPRGVTRRFVYDRSDRVIAQIDDMGHREDSYFNAGGLVDSVQTRAYQSPVVRFVYDVAGRLSKKAWPARYHSGTGTTVIADSAVFTYDLMGRPLTATTKDWAVERAYYATGDLLRDRQGALRTLNYGYDAAGRRAWYVAGVLANTTNSDSVWYRYNSGTGDLAQVGVRWRGGVKDSVAFSWDVLGRRRTVGYSNGAQVFFAYDADGAQRLLCGARSNGLSNDVYRFTLHWRWINQDGMIRNISGSGLSGSANCELGNSSLTWNQSNTYDQRHQLRTQSDGVNTTSFAYDGSGNVERRRKTPGSAYEDIAFTYLANSNILGASRPWSLPTSSQTLFFHYFDGARASEIPPGGMYAWGGRQYEYDGLGRTVSTDETQCIGESSPDNCSNTGSYVYLGNGCGYDAMGRLWRSCDGASAFGYDGENIVRTGDDTSPYDWSFVHGPGLDDPIMGHRQDQGFRIYYVTDGGGRQYAVGDRDGYDFTTSPYFQSEARLAGGTRNSETFGAQRLTSGSMYRLSFFRNRFYDQATGRWTQEDPIGVSGGLNLYAYAGSNPVSFSDPFGLCPTCPIGAVTGLTFGGIRAISNVVRGLPWHENVARDMVGGFIAGATLGLAAPALVALDAAAAPAAAASLPVVASAAGKLDNLAGRFNTSAGQIVSSAMTTGQRLVDNANGGNINMLIPRLDGGSGFIRVTTDPAMRVIISAGLMRANSVANGIASGRFTPQ